MDVLLGLAMYAGWIACVHAFCFSPRLAVVLDAAQARWMR